ncbi:alpha/beta hydrolase [Novosphingobium naphthalenivorans]|uniref:alpha/beta hydrolase n=1 Tax=Novosphingobium naphthalenivorans TaxID=273168 RepID=UPI000A0227E9|nr:lipase family protein [Novosphingobium naphthalenivorans]
MHSVSRKFATLLTASAVLVWSSPSLADPLADPWAGDGGVPAFYTWNQPIPARPGIMLRTETAPANVSLPAAGRAERILYSSTDWRDPARPTTVSGIVFFPKGKAPKSGWPVIAWAHGTTGIADVCAPSVLPRSPRDAEFLGYWLDHGYAIVATDYAGLGTPGVHPYLQYKPEGMSVLDAIRASLARYPELDATRIVTMGQSQGSEGAIAAAYLASSYAPELAIKGTVATGIVAHTQNTGSAAQLPPPQLYQDENDYGNSAYEILWFLGAARSLDPATVRPEDYIAKTGWPMLEESQKACMSGLREYANVRKLPMSQFYKRPIDALDKATTARSAFPDVHIATPVFTGTGLIDTAAQPAKQYNFISAMCAAGTTVEWHYYPGKTHSTAVSAALADAPAFVKAVMDGRPVTGSCAELVPPK